MGAEARKILDHYLAYMKSETSTSLTSDPQDEMLSGFYLYGWVQGDGIIPSFWMAWAQAIVLWWSYSY